MTENTPPSNTSNEKKPTSSLLSDIINASANASIGNNNTPPNQRETSSSSDSPKTPREPISPAIFMKLIGSLLFVSIIFFGSFLAYIAFNPAQAVFFVNTFNIDPNDIKNLLKRLINGTFGFMMIVLSILWILTLFRAFWTPKDLKRKRLLSWLFAGMVWLVLFLLLAFWGYLFNFVNANDYDNPSGSVLLYDQAQYREELYNKESRIYTTQNLIWPVEIFFDIRSNATLIEKRNFAKIESYQIDFDGARCSNDKSVITGSNPSNEQSLVCIFDEIKPYNISGTYKIRNNAGVISEIPITLPSIEIVWLVSIKKQNNNRGETIITLDASSLKKFGSLEWVYENNKVVTESSITETANTLPKRIGLKVFGKDRFDRIFVIVDSDKKIIDGGIEFIQDRTDNRLFQFSLTGITINPNEITDIEWLLDNQSVMCTRGEEDCNYTFTNFGRKSIKATVTVASGKKYIFNTEVNVNEPLNLVRHVKVFTKDGILLNKEDTYDQSLKSFILRNTIIPPEKLTFDARDVVSGNVGYTLESVLWKISNGRESREERGTKVDIEFSQPLRYTIEAIMIFKKSSPGWPDIEESVSDTIVVDIERKSLMPRLDIQMSSDYVPSLVTVDASQSESENGEIKKFIFDFWEWKPPAEWDAIQKYQYLTPGTKDIILTIISQNGETAMIKKTIVFKDQVKRISFTPSIAGAAAGTTVDFEATGTTGQIEDYIWNFWDNTPVERGYQASHIFPSPWKYNITLTIIYPDGTQESHSEIYEVTPTP
jgi:hypothetical protein